MPTDFFSSDDNALARLLQLASPRWNGWQAEDLAAILAQQMRIPMSKLLWEVVRHRADSTLAAVTDSGPAIVTLLDLLQHPAPPATLLQVAKEYAKLSSHHPVQAVPREVSKVVYFAVLSAARRAGAQISTLEDEAIRAGIEWACQQAWVDEATRKLFHEGMSSLASR